jgi:signal transduction histidine kinase
LTPPSFERAAAIGRRERLGGGRDPSEVGSKETLVSVTTTDTTTGPPLVNRPPDAAVARRRGARTTQALLGALAQTVASGFVTDKNGNGSISHFVTTGRDVARGKQAEAAMRRLNSLHELQSARIAGLLHDEASQFLASAHMAIADIARDVPLPVQARLQEVRLHLDAVAAQLRRVSHDLHPSILDDLGPIDAIKFTARTFTRRTGVHLTIDVQLDEPCPVTLGAVVYRFVQEALTNVGAHARATSASIAIAREGSRLVCDVCDDGAGFDVAATLADHEDRSSGLMVIRDRLEATGGTLDITSAPQQGTRLRAVIPLEMI